MMTTAQSIFKPGYSPLETDVSLNPIFHPDVQFRYYSADVPYVFTACFIFGNIHWKVLYKDVKISLTYKLEGNIWFLM